MGYCEMATNRCKDSYMVDQTQGYTYSTNVTVINLKKKKFTGTMNVYVREETIM